MLPELKKNLIFVSGKGGVGKTVVSQAIARRLAQQGARTLWVAFEDPTRPPGELLEISSYLSHFNCEAAHAFEEYASLKIGVNALTRIFIQNKLVRYLAKAAPGIHELVLLGKVWHERLNYEHVVVDMPSTGYGLAMFQSTRNFTELFKSGPLYKDAGEMLETFKDPEQTSQVIVALPEEMPLRESLELKDFIKAIFPNNPPCFLVNKKFPFSFKSSPNPDPSSETRKSLFALDKTDYALKRSQLENQNLKLWSEAGVSFHEIDFIPPKPEMTRERLVQRIAQLFEKKGLL